MSNLLPAIDSLRGLSVTKSKVFRSHSCKASSASLLTQRHPQRGTELGLTPRRAHSHCSEAFLARAAQRRASRLVVPALHSTNHTNLSTKKKLGDSMTGLSWMPHAVAQKELSL